MNPLARAQLSNSEGAVRQYDEQSFPVQRTRTKGDRMKYLLTLFHDVDNVPDSSSFTDEERQQMLAPYIAFRQWCEANDVSILAGDALRPAETTTTLTHGPNGTRVTSDGPFLELKEQLGGFYVIECAHADKALAAAHQVPFLKACELRPIVEFNVWEHLTIYS